MWSFGDLRHRSDFGIGDVYDRVCRVYRRQHWKIRNIDEWRHRNECSVYKVTNADRRCVSLARTHARKRNAHMEQNHAVSHGILTNALPTKRYPGVGPSQMQRVRLLSHRCPMYGMEQALVVCSTRCMAMCRQLELPACSRSSTGDTMFSLPIQRKMLVAMRMQEDDGYSQTIQCKQ